MDALDLILIVVILASAFRGFRRGAAVQILSYGGALGGLAFGVVLVLLVCPHVSGQHAKTVVALALLLVPAAVLAGAGRQFGAGLWRRLRPARFGGGGAAGGAGAGGGARRCRAPVRRGAVGRAAPGSFRWRRRGGWRDYRSRRWSRRGLVAGLDSGEQPVLPGGQPDRWFRHRSGCHKGDAPDTDVARACGALPERRGPATRG